MVRNMGRLITEIILTLDQEQKYLAEMDEKGWATSDRNITKGWIEALEYVLKQIEVITE